MRLTTFIAFRYLSLRNKPFFVSFLIWISVIGIAVGTFALIFAMAIMNGFQQDFQSKILGFTAPLSITLDQTPKGEWLDRIRSHPRVTGVRPVISGELVIQTAEGGVVGAKLRGIQGHDHPMFAQFDFFYGEGWNEKDLPAGEDHLPGILLGLELATDLQVHPDFFDEVQLIFPLGDVGPTGELLPTVKRFRVIGIFQTGFYEYDHKGAFIDYREAEKIFQDYVPREVDIDIEDIYRAETVATELRALVPVSTVKIRTWQEQNKKLFGALKLERIGMVLLLSMIIFLSALTLLGLLSIVTTEKTKDVAVLRTLGVTVAEIRRVFLWEGGILGGVGTSVGVVLGIIATLILQVYPIRLPPSYYVEILPVNLDLWHVLLVTGFGPLVCLLAVFYPSWQAAKRQIVEILRYE